MFIMLLVPAICLAEVVDVTIKGVDDGVRTNRQQDYNEALLNAKLQAIERAGVEIQSITKIVNFQLKFQTVESKAKAVLMPGFQVVDIGYAADGTYQVVLVGKVSVGEKKEEKFGRVAFFDYGGSIEIGPQLHEKFRGGTWVSGCWSYDYRINLQNLAPFIYDDAVVQLDGKPVATFSFEILHNRYGMSREQYLISQISPVKNEYCYEGARIKGRNKRQVQDVVLLIKVPIGLHEVSIVPKKTGRILGFESLWFTGPPVFYIDVDGSGLDKLKFRKRVIVKENMVHTFTEGQKVGTEIGPWSWESEKGNIFRIGGSPKISGSPSAKMEPIYGYDEFRLKFEGDWDLLEY